MKKILLFLMVVCMLAVSSLPIMASSTGIIENPPIKINNATPTIDGSITEYEGWSNAALMNYDTLGFFWHVNPLTMEGEVRFAWDEENYYYCANIIDGKETVHEITGETIPAGHNSFIYSTGEDDIDRKTDGTAFGYNGDVFGMFVDPLGAFIENGFVGDDNTPWYLVSLYEGDIARMYREKVNAADITDKVKVAGHKTENGWCFEAAIPWDMMINDIDVVSYGDVMLNKEDILKDGSLIRAGAMYHDRFIDPEADEVATWGCFVTVPAVMADGTPGHLGTGTDVMSLGLTLNVVNPSSPSDDVTTAGTTTADTTTVPDTEETELVTDDKGNTVTDDKGNKITQKVNKTTTKKASTSKPSGGSAAQTFDIGIAVALGALLTSGIGIAASKKRK